MVARRMAGGNSPRKALGPDRRRTCIPETRLSDRGSGIVFQGYALWGRRQSRGHCQLKPPHIRTAETRLHVFLTNWSSLQDHLDASTNRRPLRGGGSCTCQHICRDWDEQPRWRRRRPRTAQGNPQGDTTSGTPKRGCRTEHKWTARTELQAHLKPQFIN